MSRNLAPHTPAQRWIVGSIAFASFMCTLDSSIVNISVPSIARYFNTGTSEVSWSILAYLLTMGVLLLPAGKLGDTLGLKRTFQLGQCCFVIGSLLCGLAPSLALLIAARVLQATGSAMLVTTAYALVPRLIPKESTGWAFGLLATAAALGVTCGAPLGGFITGFFSWRWIFLINVPVGVLALLASARCLPLDAVTGKHTGLSRFDIPGALLGAGGLLSLLLALNLGQELGWVSAPILIAFASAAVLLPAFLLWEKQAPEPSFDLKLLGEWRFSAGVLASGLVYMAYAGNNFMMPLYLELAKHLPTEWVGPVLMVQSVVMMMVGPTAGRLSDRLPTRYLTMFGTFLAAAAFTFFIFAFPLPGLVLPVLFLVLTGTSFSSFLSPNNSQVMSAPPPERQGAASGLLVTTNYVCMTVGICLMETVFALMLPSGIRLHGLGTAAQAFPKGTLAGGYRAALLPAAIICGCACVTSAFVKAGPRSGKTPDAGEMM